MILGNTIDGILHTLAGMLLTKSEYHHWYPGTLSPRMGGAKIYYSLSKYFMLARLSPTEKSALQIVRQAFPDSSYLFGSRTDMKWRGGDIDILICNTTDKSNFDVSVGVERELFKKIEMKWDVVVFPLENNMNESQKRFFYSLSKIPLWQI